ncbi:MAG TPA: DNA-binding response regulator [Methylibium sp.]|uniref:DNA-binding response regulator n=1 Tax=Methylibium sp. TaxID=2067992 RepID=UPI002DB78E1D|nr:DNA-binding response regulator [Methylibium sp.]HEU4458340.1 DNA-binding response regulator [Methylibium sp.]
MSDVVLLVDDAAHTLGALCRELESEGYTVLVAPSGEAALERLEWVGPDAILLDARMPGLDGFETCRRIKAEPAWAHVPVIFMTGLSETPHIVEGFAAGGVDYVVKPVRAAEVLARLATHVRNARATRLAREALDIGGHGLVVVDAHGRLAWQSPRARAWLAQPGAAAIDWSAAGAEADTRRLGARVARRLGSVGFGETMWLLTEPGPPAAADARLAALTPREAEVLSWIAKGKTNRDVAEILGMSPRTVNKHLEHVFEKLGVETRTAAVALATRQGG